MANEECVEEKFEADNFIIHVHKGKKNHELEQQWEGSMNFNIPF
jgi:hypothetical protein